MKVLTLHQPWAQLVALGIKTIETRSWSTNFRGLLAIHAGAAEKFPHSWPIGEWRCYRSDGASAPRRQPARMFHRDIGWATRPETPVTLPLGAIVATCTLVDVVPMKAHTEPTTDQQPHLMVGTRYDPDRLLLCRPSVGYSTNAYGVASHFEWATEIVTDQRPYGDYSPGRYAWLLADVVAVDPPVPFKGGQGLTRTWEP